MKPCKPDLLGQAAEIVKTLQKAGHEALFAGGCVRDLIMKQTPHDIDVATSATPEEVEKLFDRTVAVGKKFGVMLVLVGDQPYEVATFRKEGSYEDGRHPGWVSFSTAEEDARRRDFTINGLYYDPIEKQVRDFVDGEKDLKKKLIRAIGNPVERFDEDHLRLLRAVRFTANLGFAIDPATWQAVREMAPLIKTVSLERVRDELVKMFTRDFAGNALRLLSESGLMKEILPEVEAMKGVQQPPEFHPEGDVFVHTAMLLDQLKNPDIELAISALLHDVAKPDTFDDSGDRIRFNQHAELGAEKAAAIMRRLRFPNKTIERVSIAIKNHLKFKDIRQMRPGRLKNYLLTDTFPLELELHRIDCLASHGMLDHYYFCREQLKSFEKERARPKPIVTGRELKQLGLKPGPVYKKILDELYMAQLEDQFKTKAEGQKLASAIIAQMKTDLSKAKRPES